MKWIGGLTAMRTAGFLLEPEFGSENLAIVGG